MRSLNLERLVYIGDRDSVEIRETGRRWLFKYGKPVSVPADMAGRMLRNPDYQREAVFGRPIDEICPDGGRVLLRRYGALGDVIMLRAAASCFLRHRGGSYEFSVKTQSRHADVFDADTMWRSVMAIGEPAPAVEHDHVAAMGQVAEADHRGDWRHRVDLFLGAFTKEKLTIGPEDWQIPVPEETQSWVDTWLHDRKLLAEQRSRPLVGIQLRGSGRMKTLPPEAMNMLIERVVAAGHDVILIENDPRVTEKYEAIDGVYSMAGRDPLHCIAMMKRTDACVTMDSGALWMAHIAACPVAVILGPTKPEQRITYHPLYREGRARAACLNDIIGCPACFEAAKACGMKYSCIREQPDWGVAVEAVYSELKSVLEGGRVQLQTESSN
jgi:hypothetical protein